MTDSKVTEAMSRDLLGKIVDEVFDGAIEDTSVIEEIYSAIKRHEPPRLQKRPAAFEVLDEENGTYLTRSEQAALNTGFEYNGLYRRDSAEEHAALSAALVQAPVQVGEPVTIPALSPRPSYCKPRQFLLLASYCGGETDGCTDARPCADCLSMCNIYGEDGEFISDLGPSALALPLPVQEPVKWESPEEWAIEQQAFHAAGRDDVPVDVQQLVAKLWSMYCHAASPETASVREGWKPIETADKDARSLMLGIVRKGVLEEIHIGGYRWAYNDDEVSCWWSDQADDEIVPTHWAPLLASPTDAQTVKEGE